MRWEEGEETLTSTGLPKVEMMVAGEDGIGSSPPWDDVPTQQTTLDPCSGAAPVGGTWADALESGRRHAIQLIARA